MELAKLTKQQTDALMNAHLLNKATKDETLIKMKFVDKAGKITRTGIAQCHAIAQHKHQVEWGS